MNLSFCYLTSRKEPHVEWFMDSLMPQIQDGDNIEVVLVDLHFDGIVRFKYEKIDVVQTEIMPNVWQGKHRLTKDHWWAKSTAACTALCLVKHDFVCMIDDRCVVSSHTLESIRQAQREGYVMCGSYTKRHGMKVEKGVITEQGVFDGTDGRSPFGQDHRAWLASHDHKPKPCGGSWVFGCIYALPLEWMLQINGVDCRMDSCSFEDNICGSQLANNGYPIKYDVRAHVTQDRTPSECVPVIRRTSKEKHPHDVNDRCHYALRVFAKEPRANHHINLRELREKIQRGEPWPDDPRTFDWFDQMPIEKFDDIP